jgi:hypothetical protein
VWLVNSPSPIITKERKSFKTTMGPVRATGPERRLMFDAMHSFLHVDVDEADRALFIFLSRLTASFSGSQIQKLFN